MLCLWTFGSKGDNNINISELQGEREIIILHLWTLGSKGDNNINIWTLRSKGDNNINISEL